MEKAAGEKFVTHRFCSSPSTRGMPARSFFVRFIPIHIKTTSRAFRPTASKFPSETCILPLRLGKYSAPLQSSCTRRAIAHQKVQVSLPHRFACVRGLLLCRCFCDGSYDTLCLWQRHALTAICCEVSTHCFTAVAIPAMTLGHQLARLVALFVVACSLFSHTAAQGNLGLLGHRTLNIRGTVCLAVVLQVYDHSSTRYFWQRECMQCILLPY